MNKNYTIEEATGYKQILDEKEINGKKILNISKDRYTDLYIIFDDKTFARYEVIDGELEFDEDGDENYERLFSRIVFCGNVPYQYSLTELGKAFNADLNKLISMWKQEIEDYKNKNRNTEYKEYLRLKEIYGN